MAPRAANKQLAAPPGTLVHVGERLTNETVISKIEYDAKSVTETLDWSVDPDQVTWLDVTGLHDIEKISEVGTKFGIGSLVLEDVLNTAGRPKLEDFDDSVFVVIRMITLGRGERKVEIDSQHFGLILLPGNLIITFREAPSGIFEPIRERIRSGKGRIRKADADYLMWAILDAILDHYLDVITFTDEMLTDFEDRLDADDPSIAITHLHAAKRDVVRLYREMRPVREITNTLYRTESVLIKKESAPYFRDLHDHSVQAEETIADLREVAHGLRDYYHTVVSNRMNEVMKVLTSLSTIFLPLTFLAGIYGMNFEKNMPELHWAYSYPIFWLVSIGIAVGLFFYFRRKNWI